MKKTFKKIVSMLLAAAILMSMVSSFCASAASSSSNGSILLEITTDSSKYSWGDDITLIVKAKAVGDAVVDCAVVSITPKYGRFFSTPESQIAINIAGDSESILEFTVESECNPTLQLFMPLLKLFNFGVTSEYRSAKKDFKGSAKIGIASYEFVATVEYGYENTESAKELENIKQLNGGNLPDIYMDSEDGIPSMIDGAFSGKAIKNEDDALNSLGDIKSIMGFENVNDEFSFYQKNEYDGNTFYRFQQNYKGLEVFGKNIIVVAENNKTSALSNDYEPGIDIDIEPELTAEDAINVVSAGVEDAQNVESEGLCIYANDTDPTLVYKIKCSCINEASDEDSNEDSDEEVPFDGYIFVDANLGYIIAEISSVVSETISKNETAQVYPSRSFSVTNNYWKENEKTFMCDVDNKLKAFEKKSIKDSVELNQISVNSAFNNSAFQGGSAVSSQSGQFSDRYVSLYSCLKYVSDFYFNSYGRKGFNGKYGATLLMIEKSGKNYKNAFAIGCDSYSCIGYGSGYSVALDVMAHEYTHNVEGSISSMRYCGESGALMEAYSDIMGEVIENDTTWMHFTNRNIANPLINSKPVTYNGRYWKSYTEYTKGNDWGGVHTNNTVISHAAYLMQQDKITDMNRLGELWYRSLHYLPSTANFEDCRAGVLAAAKDMGMSSAEITCIKSAFDSVGVYAKTIDNYGTSSVSGRVLNIDTLQPIAGAKAVIVKIYPGKGSESGTAISNSNGVFTINGLGVGIYEITVSAAGYMTETRLSIRLDADTNYTLPSSILLSNKFIDSGFIGGTISNAVNGNPVEGATIKLRQNYNNTTGAYVKKNNNVLTATTDSSGKYEFNNIDPSYYTMEVTKDDFVVGYFNVYASPSNEICKNQNFSISPLLSQGVYRIVLRWGQYPSDLDSHITGITSSGSSFHVYFIDKDAWDGTVNVANLDVDDTTSYGPETITLTPTTSEKYTYYIYDFTGDSNYPISTSGATIEVYNGSRLLRTFSAPTDQGSGRYWTVFEITNGRLTPINVVGNNVA